MAFPHKSVRKFLDQMAAEGWRVDRYTGGGHFRLLHPSGAQAFMASTASDHRALMNTRATLRRAVREAEQRRSS